MQSVFWTYFFFLLEFKQVKFEQSKEYSPLTPFDSKKAPTNPKKKKKRKDIMQLHHSHPHHYHVQWQNP